MNISKEMQTEVNSCSSEMKRSFANEMKSTASRKIKYLQRGLNCSARASFSRSNLIDVNSALADNSVNSDMKLYHLRVHEDFNIFFPSHLAARISAVNITLLISSNL